MAHTRTDTHHRTSSVSCALILLWLLLLLLLFVAVVVVVVVVVVFTLHTDFTCTHERTAPKPRIIFFHVSNVVRQLVILQQTAFLFVLKVFRVLTAPVGRDVELQSDWSFAHSQVCLDRLLSQTFHTERSDFRNNVSLQKFSRQLRLVPA